MRSAMEVESTTLSTAVLDVYKRQAHRDELYAQFFQIFSVFLPLSFLGLTGIA